MNNKLRKEYKKEMAAKKKQKLELSEGSDVTYIYHTKQNQTDQFSELKKYGFIDITTTSSYPIDMHCTTKNT